MFFQEHSRFSKEEREGREGRREEEDGRDEAGRVREERGGQITSGGGEGQRGSHQFHSIGTSVIVSWCSRKEILPIVIAF